MLQPTQTNLQLQLDLLELVIKNDLPIWESQLFITNQCSPKNPFNFAIESRHDSDNYIGMCVGSAIDLNQGRFGEWLDEVFTSYSTGVVYKDVFLNESELYKIEIAFYGLTDKILRQLIGGVNNL